MGRNKKVICQCCRKLFGSDKIKKHLNYCKTKESLLQKTQKQIGQLYPKPLYQRCKWCHGIYMKTSLKLHYYRVHDLSKKKKIKKLTIVPGQQYENCFVCNRKYNIKYLVKHFNTHSKVEKSRRPRFNILNIKVKDRYKCKKVRTDNKKPRNVRLKKYQDRQILLSNIFAIWKLLRIQYGIRKQISDDSSIKIYKNFENKINENKLWGESKSENNESKKYFKQRCEQFFEEPNSIDQIEANRFCQSLAGQDKQQYDQNFQVLHNKLENSLGLNKIIFELDNLY